MSAHEVSATKTEPNLLSIVIAPQLKGHSQPRREMLEGVAFLGGCLGHAGRAPFTLSVPHWPFAAAAQATEGYPLRVLLFVRKKDARNGKRHERCHWGGSRGETDATRPFPCPRTISSSMFFISDACLNVRSDRKRSRVESRPPRKAKRRDRFSNDAARATYGADPRGAAAE